MISIILPVYNKAAYIKRTLNSVFIQDYKDWELIIINDGSTDDSLRRIFFELSCQTLEVRSRVRVISQVNKGQSVARFNGLQLSRGDFVALLDGDDFWETTKLSQQVEFLQRNPSVGLVITNYCVFYENHGKRIIKRCRPVRLPPIDSLVIDWATTVGDGGLVESTGLFRREFIETVLLGRESGMSGGLEYCIKAYLSGKLALLPVYLCGYTQSDVGWHNNKQDLLLSYESLLKSDYLPDSLKKGIKKGLDSHMIIWNLRQLSVCQTKFWPALIRTVFNSEHLMYLLKTCRRFLVSKLATHSRSVELNNLKSMWES